MKFTELCDYPLPGGIVTEWVPVTESDPQAWADDPRPLTYDHEAAVRFDSDNQRETSWLGAVFEVEQRYDPTVLERALRRWMARHEAFLTVADRADGRRTYRGRDLGMRAEAVGHIDSGARIAEILTESFDLHLSPRRWPHVRVASIASLFEVSGDERFLVVFAADHVVMDAYSIMLSINEIQTLYQVETEGGDAALPAVGSHLDFSSSDRLAGDALREGHPAVELWRRYRDRAAPGVPEFGLPMHFPRIEADDPLPAGPQRGFSEFILDADESAAVGEHARGTGTGTQAAIFAAIAVAYQALCGTPLLRLVMPWHTRHEPQYLLSIGWYVGLGPLEVDLAGTATFADALHATARGIATAREVSRAPHRRIDEILGSAAEPEFVASYLDLRHVPGADRWPRSAAHTLRSASRSDRELYLWVARVPSGITLSARYPDTALAVDSMTRFVDVVTTVLRTVAAAGVDLPTSAYTMTATSSLDESRTA